MRHNGARWRSPTARWVRTYGTRRLTDSFARLGHPVSQLAIYHWIAGRNTPRLEHARLLVHLSRHRLRLEDVYRDCQRRSQPAARQPTTTAPTSGPPPSPPAR
jgi:hypothetical protein